MNPDEALDQLKASLVPEPDSRVTVQELIDRLSLMTEDIRNRYTIEVGGEYGMGTLTMRGICVNDRDETVCLDNDPM